jgi:nitrate/nitrite transporter NarK
MVGGGLLSVLSLAPVSLVEEQWQFVVLFGLVGGIAGLGNPLVVAAAIIPKWFLRYRGRAMAYATAGPGVAALTLPWSLALVEEAIGWRSTWIVLGAAAFVFTVIPALLIRRQPEDLGLSVDGAAAGGVGRLQAQEQEASMTPREAFMTSTAWLLLAAHALAFFSIAVLPTTFVPLFVGRGLTIAEAGAALIAYGVTSTVARIGWGYMVERKGVTLTAIILAAYGAVAIALLIPDTQGVFVAFVLAGIAGYAIGGILVVNPLLWPTYFGRRYLGAINGLVTPIVSMAASSGPLILALMYDATGSYTPGLLFLVATWALAIVPLFVAHRQR